MAAILEGLRLAGLPEGGHNDEIRAVHACDMDALQPRRQSDGGGRSAGWHCCRRWRRADGAVSKDALMVAAWPGVTVEEGNLTVQIAALRKALGAREDGQEWIVTVPRVGYRLMRGRQRRNPCRRLRSRRCRLLAVLPFQNIGGDAEQQYFADGIVDEITTALEPLQIVRGRLAQFEFRLQGSSRSTCASQPGNWVCATSSRGACDAPVRPSGSARGLSTERPGRSCGPNAMMGRWKISSPFRMRSSKASPWCSSLR